MVYAIQYTSFPNNFRNNYMISKKFIFFVVTLDSTVLFKIIYFFTF